MNIVHVARLYEPHKGGVETHVRQVSEELLKRGHQVSVITEQFEKSVAEAETLQGVAVIRIPYSFFYPQVRKFQIWRWVWSHRHLFTSADKVQVHDVAWWLIPVLPFIKGKFFITFHGWETQYPVSWKAQLQRWIFAHLAGGTIHVGAWIQEFYWDKPDVITYGGVVPTNVPLVKIEHKKHFVFVGRLSAENEIAKYLLLLTELKKRQLDFAMTWVGEGPFKSKCAEMGKIVGTVEKVAEYVRTADIVFASSYLAILEAQSLGKIVCAFYSHDLKKRYVETYPGVSMMVVADSVTDMADKIQALSLTREMAKKISDFARTQTWTKVTDSYEKLWHL